MHGEPGNAGQVIDLLAGAAHPAHLLDDTLLFHALEEVHPLDGRYPGIQALAGHRKDVQLQGVDSALGSSRRPGGHTRIFFHSWASASKVLLGATLSTPLR